mmetsp:Transcript_30784/g.78573  ORF Transcript_30784/g.78573 Transcript_30784/m.78573 type:complete len:295 (-) Transcript_30784:141-1025(-)
MPPQQRSLRVLLPLGQRGRWPDGLPARGQRHVARHQGLVVRTRQECLKVSLVLGKGAPALEVEVEHHFPPRRAAARPAARATAERPASLRIRLCLRAASRLLTRPLLPLLACLRVRRILLRAARRALALDLPARLLRCGRLLRCHRGVCQLGVLAVETGAAAAAGAEHLLDLDGRRLSARPRARRSVSSRSVPILVLSCTSFCVELVCGNPIQNSSGSARDARRVSLRFAWGCVPTQPFGPRGEFCPGPGCSIVEPSAKTRVLSGFRPSATTRRSSRHKRRRSLVALVVPAHSP